MKRRIIVHGCLFPSFWASLEAPGAGWSFAVEAESIRFIAIACGAHMLGEFIELSEKTL